MSLKRSPKNSIKNILLTAFLVLTPIHAICAEMSFKIIPSNASTYIYGEGEITKSTPQKLEQALNSVAEGMPILVLNSPGGNLIGGLLMGQYIRKAEIATTISRWRFIDKGHYTDKQDIGGGQCHSACALAFMGGTNRAIPPDGKIGFHQFYGNMKIDGDELLSSSQIISALVAEYLRNMGAHPRLFEVLSRAGPGEVFIPTPRQLSDLRIVSETSYSKFELAARNGKIVATSSRPQFVKGSQRLGAIEASCLNGRPTLRFFTNNPKLGLSKDQADKKTTPFTGFFISRSTGELNIGLAGVVFSANQSLLATVTLDPVTAKGLTRGSTVIHFGSVTASGIHVSGPLGEDGVTDDALEAVFNSCR